MLKQIAFLDAAEDKKSFLGRIAQIYPATDSRYKIIEKAYSDAKDAFRTKLRDSGERYFEHLRAVALILIVHLRIKDYRMIVAALLHDIVEDVPSWTIERIARNYDQEVAFLVDWITKPPTVDFASKEERNRIYNERWENAPRRAAIIKLADRLHNVITLWKCAPEKRSAKIAETLRYYLPLAEREIILVHELEEAIRELSGSPTT